MSKLLELGWHYIPDIITKDESHQIKNKILSGIISESGSLNGFWDPERGKVLFSYAPLSCAFVMKRVQPILEKLIEEELIPTYWFSTTYHNGSRMNCHTDRPSCEISVTMNICGDTPWPIKLKDFTGKKREFVTPVGHGVAYLGTQLEHWRSPLKTHEQDRFMQLFLHFVRKNGPYAEYAYDKNERLYRILKSNINSPYYMTYK
jgi:hypothetical protein